MSERILITKVVRTPEARASLFGRGHKYPDLTLFDLSDLVEVGINPDELQIGQETPCRFWAHYELSEKLNQAGNPYKDIVSLEPIAAPATSTSTDTSALLEELRQIRRLLEQLLATDDDVGSEAEARPPRVDHATGEVANSDVPVSDVSVSDVPVSVTPRYKDGSPVSDNPAERQAFEAHIHAETTVPASVDALRKWVLATAQPREEKQT